MGDPLGSSRRPIKVSCSGPSLREGGSMRVESGVEARGPEQGAAPGRLLGW